MGGKGRNYQGNAPRAEDAAFFFELQA